MFSDVRWVGFHPLKIRQISTDNPAIYWVKVLLTGDRSLCAEFENCCIIPPIKILPDIADGLVGVGLITQSEDMPGMLTLDKGYSDMSKFLNRILGLPVNLQNQLFKYFSDTLAAIITAAKRAGR